MWVTEHDWETARVRVRRAPPVCVSSRGTGTRGGGGAEEGEARRVMVMARKQVVLAGCRTN